MRKILQALLPAALLLSPLAAALAADEPAIPVTAEVATDPHDDLYAALSDGIDQAAATQQLLDSIMAGLLNEVPELELLDEAKPGLLSSLRAGMLPVLEGYSERVTHEYRPKMVAAFRETLTVDEARSVAAFYRSELGVKLLTGVSQNYSMDDTVREAIKNPDGAIQGSALEADLNRASVRAYLTLTPEERQQADLLAEQTPGMAKFLASQPKITELRTAMENEPLGAEEEAQLETLIEAAFAGFDDIN